MSARANWLAAWALLSLAAIAMADPAGATPEAQPNALGTGAIMGGAGAILWGLARVIQSLPALLQSRSGHTESQRSTADEIREAIRLAQRESEKAMQEGFQRLIEYEHQQTLVAAELRTILEQQKDLLALVHERMNGEHDRIGKINARLDSIHEHITRRSP